MIVYISGKNSLTRASEICSDSVVQRNPSRTSCSCRHHAHAPEKPAFPPSAMKTPNASFLLPTLIFGCALASRADAALNTLEAWGDAAGTTPPASFTINGSTITITAGGADFWGTSDHGVFLWDNTGVNTTTGDFTATVRHVSTTTPAPEWGRDGIIVRATQSPGLPSANDAHWLPHRKSNGQFISGRRPAPGRRNTYRATDIGNRWSQLRQRRRMTRRWQQATSQTLRSTSRPAVRAIVCIPASPLTLVASPDAGSSTGPLTSPTAISGLQGSAEVIVGLTHQSHPQTISPDTNDINTVTYDRWTYSGSYDPTKFGPPRAPPRGR